MVPPETSRVSFLGGYWFIFSDHGRQIAGWGSSLTGRERIYVGGALVSEQRKIRRQTAHDFSVDEHRYRVSFEVERSLVRCRLERDGAAVAALQIRRLQRRYLTEWQIGALAIVLVGAAAWVSETFALSYWPLGAAAAVLVVGVYCYVTIGSKFVVEPG
ncbi:MAG: hypothetical protein EPO67_22650 [Reyranella sp.]|nr:MAG: hypothetical protein EPO67_22650 [Reyranella sp.]